MTEVMPERSSAAFDLDAKYREESGSFFFTGVQALVRVPMDQMRADRRAGLRTATFVSGYQGSPLGGYDREIISHKALMDELTTSCTRPGLNEDLGATAVMGSQLSATVPRTDATTACWASGTARRPGLDRAGDAIRHAAYAGTPNTAASWPSPATTRPNKSSTLPSASEFTLADLHLPILHPGNVQEVLDLGTPRRLPVAGRGAVVGHQDRHRGGRRFGHRRGGPGSHHPGHAHLRMAGQAVPAEGDQPSGRRRPPTRMEQEIYEARYEMARLYGIANKLNRITINLARRLDRHRGLGPLLSRGARRGIDSRPRRGRARRNGIRLLQMGMIYPFDRARSPAASPMGWTRSWSSRRSGRSSKATCATPSTACQTPPGDRRKVRPRASASSCPRHGALDADCARRTAAPPALPAASTPSRLTDRSPEKVARNARSTCCPPAPRTSAPVAPTPPAPRSPSEPLVGGRHRLPRPRQPDGPGTGRHGHGQHPDGRRRRALDRHRAVRRCRPLHPEPGRRHLRPLRFAVRSRMAVSAKSHITFKILYNGAVAMTGGQDAAGAMAVPQLTYMAAERRRDHGHRHHRRTRASTRASSWPTASRCGIAPASSKPRRCCGKVPGVTVLIHDQQCAAEKRRDRKRGIVIGPAPNAS